MYSITSQITEKKNPPVTAFLIVRSDTAYLLEIATVKRSIRKRKYPKPLYNLEAKKSNQTCLEIDQGEGKTSEKVVRKTCTV